MFEKLTASDWAGWVGATTGTLALAWEIYTWWRSGPQLKLQVNGNMKLWNEISGESPETYISIKVINRGDAPTTLDGLYLHTYKNILWWAFRRPEKDAYFINPTPPSSILPFVIDPGRIWIAQIQQHQKWIELSQNKILCVLVSCAHSEKPIRQRIKIRSSANER